MMSNRKLEAQVRTLVLDVTLGLLDDGFYSPSSIARNLKNHGIYAPLYKIGQSLLISEQHGLVERKNRQGYRLTPMGRAYLRRN